MGMTQDPLAGGSANVDPMGTQDPMAAGAQATNPMGTQDPLAGGTSDPSQDPLTDEDSMNQEGQDDSMDNETQSGNDLVAKISKKAALLSPENQMASLKYIESMEEEDMENEENPLQPSGEDNGSMDDTLDNGMMESVIFTKGQLKNLGIIY